MDILKKIYSGSIKPSETDIKSNKAYFREKNRINQHYNSLKSNLTENELKTLEKLMRSEHEMREKENMRFFVNGFKLGMSFAIEALD